MTSQPPLPSLTVIRSQNKDFYYVMINGYRDIFIDDKEIPFNTKMATTSKEPTKIEKKITRTFLIHYKNDKEETLDIPQYNKKEESLTDKGTFSEDDDDWYFHNLDDEYAYKKFKKEWVPVFETEIEFQPISFTVRDEVFTDKPFITPLHKIDSTVSFESDACKYDRIDNIIDLIKTEGIKRGYRQLDNIWTDEKKTFYLVSHYNEINLKIEGQYLHSKFVTSRSLTLHLKEAEDMYQKDIEMVKEWWDQHERNKLPVKEDWSLNGYSVLGTLRSIYKRVDAPKQRGDAIKDLRDLINKLEGNK